MPSQRNRNTGRRIAFVGLGKQGRKLADAVSALGYEIVAGCDLDRTSLKKFSSSQPNALATSQISDLRGVSPEVVVVGTLAAGHLPVIRELDAIGVRKIFCEKPVVGSMMDLLDLQELVVKRDLKISVNHSNLWNSDFQIVKQRVQNEPLGALRRVAAHFKAAGFGNMGCHNLVVMLDFLETRVSRVLSAQFTSELAKKRAPGYDDRNGKALFLLDKGIELELNNCPSVKPRTWRLEFEFERGRIELHQAASSFAIWNGTTGRISEIPFQRQGYGLKKSPETAYPILDRALSCLFEDKPEKSLALGCQAVEAIIAAQHCAVDDAPVSLPLSRDTETLFRFS